MIWPAKRATVSDAEQRRNTLASTHLLPNALAVHAQALRHLVQRPARMPVHEYLGHIDYVERSPRHRAPRPRREARLLHLDGQVHHDTHAVPMGNYVSAVGNYVIVSPSELGNYMIADT